MKRYVIMIISALILSACQVMNVSSPVAGVPKPIAGFEIYEHNGNVPRLNDAVDIYIAYSPESEAYMPEIIRQFNQFYADGIHPITKMPLTDDNLHVYAWGTQPETGSSGTVSEGIINAVRFPNNDNIYMPTIFQPSVSTWLALINFETGRDIFNLDEIVPTALSPVVIGIFEERLQEILNRTGKDRRDIGWSDLLTVLEEGWETGDRRGVYYGHSDPTISSTGLSTFITEFYACARREGFTERRITEEIVFDKAVQDCVRDIEQLIKHYSDRTEDFLEYIGQGPDYLDFVALEETDLVCINLGARQGNQQCIQPRGGKKLIAIYPAEGTFWHEHPFATVQYDVGDGGWTTQRQRDGAAIFTDFMLTEEPQRLILDNGFRPANPDIEVGYPFIEENGVLPEGPDKILALPDYETILAMRQSWSLVKKQTDILLLIDVSGSMQDENKLTQAQDAAQKFIEQMEITNRIGLAIFSDEVNLRVPLEIAETNAVRVNSFVASLRADGGTAMYDALIETIQIMENEDSGGDRIRAIVLLSDGEDTGSQNVTLNDVIRAIEASRISLNPVLVIPVAYGNNADTSALNAIARASVTTVQVGDPETIGDLLDVIASFF